MFQILQDTTAVHAVTSGAPTTAAAVGFFFLAATQAVQAWTAHQKGKKGSTHGDAALKRMETTLNDFIAEQRETNQSHDRRINDLSSHLIGPDGKNGIRSRVEKLERRSGVDDRRSP